MSNHDPARHPSMPETGLAIVRSMKLCVAMFIGATAFSASGVAMHRLFDPRDRGVYRIIAGAQFGTEGRIPLAGGRSYLVESGLLTLCLIGIAIPVATIITAQTRSSVRRS